METGENLDSIQKVAMLRRHEAQIELIKKRLDNLEKEVYKFEG